MVAPRVLVLRAPGTNCDGETQFAFERAGGRAERMHVNRLRENPRATGDFQILCIPGGFSYGDDIAAGRILGNQMQRHLADSVRDFCAAGKLVLGICNGFQVLIKSGILLPQDTATLTWNQSGKFEDRWVHLRTESPRCVFLQGITSIYLPVAHAEGRFVFRDQATAQELASRGQLALHYAAANGQRGGGSREVAYPENPNGSAASVAGVCDESGRVFGLMPHPERYIDRTHHPRWTRGEGSSPGDGLAIFQNAVGYFR